MHIYVNQEISVQSSSRERCKKIKWAITGCCIWFPSQIKLPQYFQQNQRTFSSLYWYLYCKELCLGKCFWLLFLFAPALQWWGVGWGWWKRSRVRTWQGCSETRSAGCQQTPSWCNSWRGGGGSDRVGVRQSREIFLVTSSLRRKAGRPRRWWRWWRGRG